MEHIKLFWSKLNIRKLLSSCESGHHWEELVFLYTHYDEYDNACLTMIKHPAVAFEHVKFKETIAKVASAPRATAAARCCGRLLGVAPAPAACCRALAGCCSGWPGVRAALVRARQDLSRALRRATGRAARR